MDSHSHNLRVTRVTKRSRLENNSPPPDAPDGKKEKLDCVPVPVEPAKKNNKAFWSATEKSLFFEAIGECGRDFKAIAKYITSRLAKRGDTASNRIMTSEQIRCFYYRTWNKLSKNVEVAEDLKKQALEIYTLVSWGQLRKYQKIAKRTKMDEKLNEMVNNGSTIIRMNTKNVRVRTPMCPALKRLAIPKDVVVVQPSVPNSVVLKLTPRTNHAHSLVQSCSHNPRVQISAKSSSFLADAVRFVLSRWLQSCTLVSNRPRLERMRIFLKIDSPLVPVHLTTNERAVVIGDLATAADPSVAAPSSAATTGKNRVKSNEPRSTVRPPKLTESDGRHDSGTEPSGGSSAGESEERPPTGGGGGGAATLPPGSAEAAALPSACRFPSSLITPSGERLIPHQPPPASRQPEPDTTTPAAESTVERREPLPIADDGARQSENLDQCLRLQQGEGLGECPAIRLALLHLSLSAPPLVELEYDFGAADEQFGSSFRRLVNASAELHRSVQQARRPQSPAPKGSDSAGNPPGGETNNSFRIPHRPTPSSASVHKGVIQASRLAERLAIQQPFILQKSRLLAGLPHHHHHGSVAMSQLGDGATVVTPSSSSLTNNQSLRSTSAGLKQPYASLTITPELLARIRHHVDMKRANGQVAAAAAASSSSVVIGNSGSAHSAPTVTSSAPVSKPPSNELNTTSEPVREKPVTSPPSVAAPASSFHEALRELAKSDPNLRDLVRSDSPPPSPAVPRASTMSDCLGSSDWFAGTDISISNLSFLEESPAKQRPPGHCGGGAGAGGGSGSAVEAAAAGGGGGGGGGHDVSRDALSSRMDGAVVDAHLQLLANEDSVDYVARFADLVAQVNNTSD